MANKFYTNKNRDRLSSPDWKYASDNISKDLLLVPIDKATGSIALVSKRFYGTVITDFKPLLLENWDWVLTHLHKKAMKIQAMKLILSMCSTLSDPTNWFNHFVLVSIGKSCFSYDNNYVINRDNDDHNDYNFDNDGNYFDDNNHENDVNIIVIMITILATLMVIKTAMLKMILVMIIIIMIMIRYWVPKSHYTFTWMVLRS